MLEELKRIETEALAAVAGAADAEQLTEIKVAYLGKKGKITSVSRQMGQVSPEERPALEEALKIGLKALKEAKL